MGKPKDAPRDIVILAILVNHPELLERHIEEIAALELSNRTLATFRDQLLAHALEAPAPGEAPEAAALGAGARTHPPPCLANAGLVVFAPRGGFFRRRSGFTADAGLASQGRGAK